MISEDENEYQNIKGNLGVANLKGYSYTNFKQGSGAVDNSDNGVSD